jgi:hypothetical protein
MAVLRPGVLPSEGSRCLVGRELCPALQNGSLDAGMKLVIQGFGRLSSRKGRRSVRGVCRKEERLGSCHVSAREQTCRWHRGAAAAVVLGEGEGCCDGAAWMVLQETEAGIAMGGVEHYYCTAQRPHSQKHNLALERRDPLRAGTNAAA